MRVDRRRISLVPTPAADIRSGTGVRVRFTYDGQSHKLSNVQRATYNGAPAVLFTADSPQGPVRVFVGPTHTVWMVEPAQS